MVGQGGMAAYTAAKSAVLGLTRSLARDFGPYNIRVNAIAPGWIMTQRQIDLWLTPEGEKELMQRQCLKRKLVSRRHRQVHGVPRLRRGRAAAPTSNTWSTAAGSDSLGDPKPLPM